MSDLSEKRAGNKKIGMSFKLGAAASGFYLLLVLIAAALPFATRSAELGMVLFSLTQPWSLLFGMVLISFKSESVFASTLLGIVIYALGAAINAVIIYILFEFAGQRLSGMGEG